jgi:exosortase
LLLTVPLPSVVLHKSVELLQAGSAQVTAMIFDLLNVPYVREGFVFNLRQVSIEVAEECSGLRSSLAVLILALIAGHLYLRTLPSKVAFLAASLSVMVVKNGIRIATLTLLSVYASPSFLSGRLHHQGGIVFFLLGLAILAPVLLLLRRLESKGTESKREGVVTVRDVLADPSRID